MSKGRLKDTDGVIAYHHSVGDEVPPGADLEALRSSVPVFLAHALSYLNIGIFRNIPR